MEICFLFLRFYCKHVACQFLSVLVCRGIIEISPKWVVFLNDINGSLWTEHDRYVMGFYVVFLGKFLINKKKMLSICIRKILIYKVCRCLGSLGKVGLGWR